MGRSIFSTKFLHLNGELLAGLKPTQRQAKYAISALMRNTL